MKDNRYRGLAAFVLGEICHDDETIAIRLTACLQERLSTVDRVRIIDALWRFGPKAKCAIPALIEALDDTSTAADKHRNYRVRMAATYALWAIGPEAKPAVEKLVRIGNDQKMDLHDRQQVKEIVERIDPDSAKRIRLGESERP